MEEVLLITEVIRESTTLIIKIWNKKLLTIEIHHEDNLEELAKGISSIINLYYNNYKCQIDIVAIDEYGTIRNYYVDETTIRFEEVLREKNC